MPQDQFPFIGGSGPGGEKMVAGMLLLENAHEAIPVDESVVERALEPYWTPDVNDPVAVNSSFVGLLRTAGYFILDSDQVADALASEPPVGIPSFPPLPFRRVWIETHKKSGQTEVPTTYLRYTLPESEKFGVKVPEQVCEILGVGIVESIARQEWDVFVPFQLIRPSGSKSGLKVSAYKITPYEVLKPKLEYVNADVALKTLLTMAINGAHLITARNVPHREVFIPRPQRRRAARSFRFAPRIPKMYYVDLASAGEGDEIPTSRTYHVRWLVMGHWRHLPNADEVCTCLEHRFDPKPATWIDPYVKGPVGSPWKGRPVHRDE